MQRDKRDQIIRGDIKVQIPFLEHPILSYAQDLQLHTNGSAQ